MESTAHADARVHGPAQCPVAPAGCEACSGEHHWIESGGDPEDDLAEELDGDSRRQVREYDQQHGTDHELAYYACKHCPAWAEHDLLDEFEDDDEGLEVVEAKPLGLLPPPPGHCHRCAVKHEEWQAHNCQSLYYQMRFRMAHGRPPRWSDAVAHCRPEVQQQWKEGLIPHGVWTADDDVALAAGTAVVEPTLYAA